MNILIIGETHNSHRHYKLKTTLVKLIENNTHNIILGMEEFNYDKQDGNLIRERYGCKNIESIFGIDNGDLSDFIGYLLDYAYLHENNKERKFKAMSSTFMSVLRKSRIMEEFSNKSENNLIRVMVRYIDNRKIEYPKIALRNIRDTFIEFTSSYSSYCSENSWRTLQRELIYFYYEALSREYIHVNEIIDLQTIHKLVELLALGGNEEGANMWSDINKRIRDKVIVSNILDKIKNKPEVEALVIIIGKKHCDNLKGLLLSRNSEIRFSVTVHELQPNIDPVQLANDFYNLLCTR